MITLGVPAAMYTDARQSNERYRQRRAAPSALADKLVNNY